MIVAAVLLVSVSIIIVGYIVLTSGALTQDKAKRTSPNIETVRIESAQVPLSAESGLAVGMIEPIGENVVTKGDVSLDLSLLDKGYLYVKYDGPKEELRFEIYKDANDSKPPLYAYPREKGWQGYALPFGPGNYTLFTYALDDGTEIAQPENITTFSFTAEFAEEEPYRYRNAYSYFDEGSLAVTYSAYLIAEEEQTQGHVLTDADKTELIMEFINGNITWDYPLLEQIETGTQPFYFPDSDATLTTEKGLCSDWASLAAVMLKSSGVPTRIHDGYLLKPTEKGTKELSYHTWLTVYYEGSWHMFDPTVTAEEIVGNKTPDPTLSSRTLTGKQIDTDIEYQSDNATVY
jgi:hypothetical protein